MTQNSIFDAKLLLPDAPLAARERTLLGFDGRYRKIHDQLRLLLNLGELATWSNAQHQQKLLLCDLVAEQYPLTAFAEDRRALLAALAAARADTARYRALVVDFETNAPSTLLGGPGSPDDLKLIVGIGPMLERMLHQLGVTTFRQIAHWTEHDIDVFDAKLAEFPGRIRRDAWVVQARALHQSKYGERA